MLALAWNSSWPLGRSVAAASTALAVFAAVAAAAAAAAAGPGGYQVLLNGKNVTPRRLYSAAADFNEDSADTLEAGRCSLHACKQREGPVCCCYAAASLHHLCANWPNATGVYMHLHTLQQRIRGVLYTGCFCASVTPASLSCMNSSSCAASIYSRATEFLSPFN